MNTRQKPATALAFKRGGRGTVPVLPNPPAYIPEPPPNLAQAALDAWDGFWHSGVSGAVDMRRDGERLRHWAWCVSQRYEVESELAATQLVEGARGQLFAHPLWAVWQKLNTEIERAEAKFGMNPLDKMRLTGALDQAEAAEQSIKTRRDRRPVEA